MRTLTVGCTVALALSLSLATSSRAGAPVGRVVIKLEAPAKTDADAAAAVRALASASALDLHLVRRSVLGWVVARVDATSDDDVVAALERLRAAKGVLTAEAVTLQHALRAPNDELYGELWGFAAIGAERAWDATTGLASQRIGVVDSGINRDHIDLMAADVYGYDFVSTAEAGEDGDGRDPDYDDVSPGGHYHGSHVAGTMVASANDGIGVPGLNWQAGLVTVRALGAGGSGFSDDIVEGAAWLAGFDVPGVPNVGAHRVSVINLSLGGTGSCSSFESEVYSAIQAAGVTVVAAAGNEGNDVPTARPADCPGVIAVGAMGPTGALASYSNFDSRIDVVAPGGDSAGDPRDAIISVDGSTDDDYVGMDGTSMAAPHVAGVVSLMQAINPKLSPRQIREILVASPYTCDGCANEAFLDAVDAVARARTTDGELDDAPPPSDEPTPSCPSHASYDASDGYCYCDAGYQVNDAGNACVREDDVPKPTDGDDRDDDDDDDDDDDRETSARPRYFSGCSSSGAPVSFAALWALLLVVRRAGTRRALPGDARYSPANTQSPSLPSVSSLAR